jgi:hypothetical protein
VRGHHLVAVALALATSILCGAAPTPGGCGSSVTDAWEVGSWEGGCDTVDNGVYACSTAEGCGGPGQCACENEDGQRYCGSCLSDPVTPCRYCAAEYQCPENPCSNECPGKTGICPSEAPVNCGNGFCCPNEYPACCIVKEWCGKDILGCPTKEPDDVDPGGSGGIGCGAPPGGCSAMGYDFHSASAGDGCCTSSGCLDACADDCATGWYEVGGQAYGPCDVADQSCMNAAAQQAVDASAGCY